MSIPVRTALGFAALLALGAPTVAQGQAAAAKTPAPAGKDMTITGTVVDLACKFSKGSAGTSHLACFHGCSKAGVPIGILSADGTLYLPVMHEENQNPRLDPFAEQEVTVTGKVYAAGGAKTIEIATIARKS